MLWESEVLRIEPTVSLILGKFFITELHLYVPMISNHKVYISFTHISIYDKMQTHLILIP